MKEIVKHAARIAGELAEECKDCNGDGEVQNACPCCETASCHPIYECPTCARWREIRDWRWHEWAVDPNMCKCGIAHNANEFTNPTFDIPELRELLEDLGLWERFETWMICRLPSYKTELLTNAAEFLKEA